MKETVDMGGGVGRLPPPPKMSMPKRLSTNCTIAATAATVQPIPGAAS
jgi:hypothetical protein